jgi:class 3 adenylate cyclase/TolB-like protein/Flp pilus assembly protein TadD
MTVELVTARTVPTAIAPVAAQRRRLMAVMLADVVGYSRMMSRSEDETHARFASHARELIEPTIHKYGGHLLRSMGDGLLVEFSSAVDAVRCALDIQRGLAARQTNENQKDRMQLRIGINTGDVLVDEHDIYGNSVNIAARLEALASPGMVCVSQSIYDQTRAQPRFFFADRGERRVKNIPYPVHVYEVAYEPIRVSFLSWLVARWSRPAIAACVAAIAVAGLASALMFRELHGTVARTNRIVVLPFKNFDTADAYLADAITDDLTTELSRLRRAWVIASGTAFTYKDKPNDPRQIGRELRVRYALEGSIRRAGPLVQVNAQLIDTESGINLWANSFAYESSSLLDLQDSLMGRIAVSLNDEVIKAGVRHEVGTLAADHNPLDERMRAMAASTGIPTPESILETRKHAEAGLMADPDNARLLGLLAYWLASDVLNGWNNAGTAEVESAEAAASKAIKLDPTVPRAHIALGWVHRIRGDHQGALNAFKDAIKADPNFAAAYAQAANEMVFLGDSKSAIKQAEKAIELSPKDLSIDVFRWTKGRAQFAAGEYENAADALGESVRGRRNLWFTQAWLVAALALCNRDKEAHEALERFKYDHPARADLAAITRYYGEAQYQNPPTQRAVAELLKGLRKAGLT